MIQSNRHDTEVSEKDEDDHGFQDNDMTQELNSEDILDESSVFSIQEKEQDEMDIHDAPYPIERVRWRDGKQEMIAGEHTTERHVWPIAGERGKPSAWDSLFTKQILNEVPQVGGLDELIDLFNSTAGCFSSFSQLSVIEENPEEASIEVTTSQLTQNAQRLANSIEAKVKADPTKLTKVENACPNWKENIRFALLQRDPVEIQSALENIERSKVKLAKMKQEFLAAWSRKQVVMQLFELALTSSLQRSTLSHEHTSVATAAFGDTTTDEKSYDEDTVIDFSPLSQESLQKYDDRKPDHINSSMFYEMTQTEAQEDNL